MTVIAYALIDVNGNVLAMSQKEAYVKSKQRKEFPEAEVVELVRLHRPNPLFNETMIYPLTDGVLRGNSAQMSLFTTNSEGVGQEDENYAHV